MHTVNNSTPDRRQTPTPPPPGERWGYARVSTKSQDVWPQIHALRAAGAATIITETATGTRSLPVRDTLIPRLTAGDTLIVTSLDRLSRNGQTIIDTVTRLTTQRVRVRALHPPYDNHAPDAAATLGLFLIAGLATTEHTLISTRTRQGLTAAAAHGRRGGRPTKLTPTKLTAAHAAINAGATIAAAARTIGVHRTTLSKALTAAANG